MWIWKENTIPTRTFKDSSAPGSEGTREGMIRAQVSELHILELERVWLEVHGVEKWWVVVGW